MTFDQLHHSQYVSIESFKRNGDGVKTPVWVTSLNGKLYAITEAHSWKVKRIRNNPYVNLADCDARGTLKSEAIPAQATVLTDNAEVAAQQARLNKKYGLFARFFSLMGRLRGSTSVVLELTPAEAS